MKISKVIIGLSTTLILTACESMPKDMQSLGNSINSGIQSINTALQTPGTTNSNQTTTTRSRSSQAGLLSSSQCQNAVGKTKSQIESMANEKLTDSRAYSMTSFAVTYNFEISDRQSRYGANLKPVCSLTFDGNKATSKVLNWSVVG